MGEWQKGHIHMNKNDLDFLTLADIDPEEEVRILKINLPDEMRRRMLDLGISPGTHVTCSACAPCGRPKAYTVCSCVFAIRYDDAQKIEVEYVSENKSQKQM